MLDYEHTMQVGQARYEDVLAHPPARPRRVPVGAGARTRG